MSYYCCDSCSVKVTSNGKKDEGQFCPFCNLAMRRDYTSGWRYDGGESDE